MECAIPHIIFMTFTDYLCTELLTARLMYSKKKVTNAMEIEMVCIYFINIFKGL